MDYVPQVWTGGETFSPGYETPAPGAVRKALKPEAPGSGLPVFWPIEAAAGLLGSF